jgi:hypothetical protein
MPPLPPLDIPPLPPLDMLPLLPLSPPPVILGYAQRYVGSIIPPKPPPTSMHISPGGQDVSVGPWHETRQFPVAPPVVPAPLVPPLSIMPNAGAT